MRKVKIKVLANSTEDLLEIYVRKQAEGSTINQVSS